MNLLLHTLTIVAALGSATMGGVFFAFSAFVMNGLARLPPAQGIAAMQSINVTAVRPALMTALFGTTAACISVSVVAIRTWSDGSAALLLSGSALYLLGTVGLTIAYNVPLNNSLAAVEPSAAGAAAHWSRYLTRWTIANHVRAAAAIAAAAAFTLALTR